MKTIAAMVAKSLVISLARTSARYFGSGHQDIAERLGTLARSTVELPSMIFLATGFCDAKKRY
jgi:hypothetical protein